MHISEIRALNLMIFQRLINGATLVMLNVAVVLARQKSLIRILET